jgi:hypothetical protein
MSGTYVRITEDAFDAFMTGLADYDVVDEPGTAEKVYELQLPHEDLGIRVYSTIERGEGRDRGEDAIRCVVWHNGRGCPVGGRRKTLRIDTWRENLGGKIEDLYASWREHWHGVCPECGEGLLVEREPGRGDDWAAFLACTEYPACGHTEDL